MNCFFHPEEVSVAQCIDCGKGLCKDCAGKYAISICDNCNANRNAIDKKQALKSFIPSLILFIIVSGAVLFIASYPTPLMAFIPRIVFSIFIGWFFAGAIRRLFRTRSKTGSTYVKTTSGLDAKDFFNSAKGVFWIFGAVFIGPFEMTKDLIIFITNITKARKVDALIKANKTDN